MGFYTEVAEAKQEVTKVGIGGDGNGGIHTDQPILSDFYRR
jgi:hypothetical protein